jgi:serine/threonine-protein kinase RsbW
VLVAMTPDTLVVPAQTDNLADVRSFVRRWAAELGLRGDDLEDLVLATDEAVTNVILHGYRGAPGQVEISVGSSNGSVVVVARDTAPPLDPTSVPFAPSGTVPVPGRAGGWGVCLMHRLLDGLEHRPRPGGGNELTLVKRVARRRQT